MTSLSLIPVGFWLATIVLLGLMAEIVARPERPWSKPLLVAYSTVGMWYHLDFAYNDPAVFLAEFPTDVLNQAFLEVCWFLVCLRGFVRVFADLALKRVDIPQPMPSAVSAHQEYRVFVTLTLSWAVLAVYALIRTDGDVMSLICPPLSERGFPWGRPGVGSAWDFVTSIAAYIHLAICAMAGVLIAVAHRKELRMASTVLWLSSCPVFVFGRARNSILAIVLPGVLAYIFTQRVSLMHKVALAVGVFWILVGFSGHRPRGIKPTNSAKYLSPQFTLYFPESINVFI